MGKDDAFRKKLLETFRVEAAEHIAAISTGLIDLEKSPAPDRQREIIEAVFREAHSMKGAARSVNETAIESLCQSFEGVLAALKRKTVSPGRTLLDLLHRSVNALGTLLAGIESGGEAREKTGIRDIIRELNLAAQSASSKADDSAGPAEPQPSSAEEPPVPAAGIPPVATDSMRISKAKLDAILLQGEAFLSVKQTLAHQTAELREITALAASLRKAATAIRPVLRAAQSVKSGRSGGDAAGDHKLFDYFEATGDGIAKLHYALAALGKSQRKSQWSVGTMVDALLDDLKTVSLLPFSSLLDMMPKIVRDLARDQGKEVVLVTRGEDIELDKRILDEIREPLIHLVRNSMDHGIEPPGVRAARNKPVSGTIVISAAHREGKSVEVVVSDDGAGIDTARIRGAAIRLGILSRQGAGDLNDQSAFSLIFRSGISASPIITDLSGRGLGLAIVRERIEKLGGTVFCEAGERAGVVFRILLPITLTTFRGVLVRIDDNQYVIPVVSLERTARVKRAEIKSLENRETITLEGRAVSFVPLRTVLELPQEEQRSQPASIQVVVLGTGAHRIAFGVDEVLQEQEILVKDLGMQLKRVRNISGATVLGTGKVVPILNVSDLMKSAVKAASAPAPARTAGEAPALKRSILVVEDSITTRSLLKNILESLGYDVRTAVDGIDALTMLKAGEFDLVVSDVDMPRMNGFNLTEKIRADKRLAETPVILVTALESREDRERGIDVGANAYIVKSSFDQGNLLEAVKRLI